MKRKNRTKIDGNNNSVAGGDHTTVESRQQVTYGQSFENFTAQEVQFTNTYGENSRRLSELAAPLIRQLNASGHPHELATARLIGHAIEASERGREDLARDLLWSSQQSATPQIAREIKDMSEDMGWQ